jgi:2-polyprenyl-3-methyl-5-hydroxy-6-metoxy-1,4-benzoquinol methylase
MTCSVIEEAVLGRIRKHSKLKGAEILDAPCGKGAFASSLVQMGFVVSGADLITDAAPLLGDRFRRVDLTGRLPWNDRSFDVVTSIEGIEHLENPHAYLRELHRVLRPAGWLFLTTPNVASLRSRVRFFGSSFFHKDPSPLNEETRDPLHHISLRPFHLLRYDLHTNGFRIEEVACTHIKPISFAYAVFAPWMWLYTATAFRKEKNADQKKRNRQIRRTLLSAPVLFGENLLIVARKL